jgi:hypothetical protein
MENLENNPLGRKLREWEGQAYGRLNEITGTA